MRVGFTGNGPSFEMQQRLSKNKECNEHNQPSATIMLLSRGRCDRLMVILYDDRKINIM